MEDNRNLCSIFVKGQNKMDTWHTCWDDIEIYLRINTCNNMI